MKCAKQLGIACILAVCCLVLRPADLFSQGNIKLGPLGVDLLFKERLEYDDNIYRVSGKDGSKNSDIINTYTPGLGLNLPLGAGTIPGKHEVGLDWHSDFKNYRDNADQNQQNHYFDVSGSFKFPKGFDVLLSDKYIDTWESAGSDRDTLHARIENTGQVKISLPDYFRRFDLDFTYKNFDQDYDERALQRANRNEHSFTWNVPFKLTPKVSLFPEYTYGITKVERETRVAGDDLLSDSDFNRIFGGIRWQATAKTSGVVKIGYVNRDFDEPAVADIRTLTYLASISSNLSKRTSLLVNFTRTDEISEFTSGSNGYVRTGNDFNLSHTIKNVKASLLGSYAKSVFHDSSRKDDDYKIGCDVNYTVNDWSSASMGYYYKDRHSNFDSESDRINNVYIGFNILY